MQNLIMVWSDPNHRECAAPHMQKRLQSMGMRVEVCYCQRGLASFGDMGREIALAVIFVDSPDTKGPVHVLGAIAETVKFKPQLPILLVQWDNPSRPSSKLNIHGVMSYDNTDDEFRKQIELYLH